MDKTKHLELTFIGRTYMMLLYVVATIFLLLILGGILNNTSETPNESYNLFFAVAIWISFVAGGIIYEAHRLAFKRLGMERRSVRILLPLIFLLVVGLIVIAVSESPFHPTIRLVISIIAVISFFIIWKVLTMAIKDKLRSVREREF
jgi:tellurite resistance protein TehA-like permease